MLGQTAFATWQMKAVLPYQGWSLVDLQDVFVQPLAESARQILSLRGADQHPAALRVAVLLGLGGLLDRADGLPAAARQGPLQHLGQQPRHRSDTGRGAYGAGDADRQRGCAACSPGWCATYESLKATGELEHFDIFVLSDSNDPDTCVAEQKAWVEVPCGGWPVTSSTVAVGAG